ncbi:MAG: DUF1566 domain-containing protein [Gammaproteobacteria bacterium]|nr:DUF1566 domain-containing protein [Gammaproteobacteria bacterium]
MKLLLLIVAGLLLTACNGNIKSTQPPNPQDLQRLRWSAADAPEKEPIPLLKLMDYPNDPLAREQERQRSQSFSNRYRDLGDGTLTDIKTGLQWMRCMVGQSWSGSGCEGNAKKYKWDDAVKLTANFAGYQDWRLPTIKELNSLVYCSSGSPDFYPFVGVKDKQNGCNGDHQKPTINLQAFPDTPASYVWSASAYADGSNDAWFVYFNYGYSDSGNRDNGYGVRLVRGGQ